MQMGDGAAASMAAIGKALRFTFKPHPYFPLSLAPYPGIVADVTMEPLHSILADYDIAIAANSTSAAVDAYVSGLAVIIGLDGASLNLSPLRGQPGAAFASDAAELVLALRASLPQAAEISNVDNATIASDKPVRDSFFFLNPLLSRWTGLLSLKLPGSEQPISHPLSSPIPQ